ncbi:MAG: hypothetical protein ACYCT9_08885 [Leptospirillum sp.]
MSGKKAMPAFTRFWEWTEWIGYSPTVQEAKSITNSHYKDWNGHKPNSKGNKAADVMMITPEIT